MDFVVGPLPGIGADVDLEPRCGEHICTNDHHCACRVQAVLDKLAISKVWLLPQALKHLTGGWLENKNNKSGPGRMRKMLDARPATSISNQIEIRMIREAKQQWKMWHSTLSSKFIKANQAWSTNDDCEGSISSTVRNTQTPKVESNLSSKIAGTMTSEKAKISTIIEESPKRSNLNEELARRPSNVRSVSYSEPATSEPRPLISGHNLHGSAPNVLQQPKTRLNPALQIRSRASAPQTSKSVDNRFSAKNTDIGNPLGPSRHVETGTADDPSGVSASTFRTLSEDHRALVKPKEIMDVDETIVTRPLIPNFQPWEGQRPKSTTVITREVFDVMKKPLSETKQLGEGHIYTLRVLSCPGFFKIGRTIQSISQRKEQISACLPCEMEVINDGDYCMVPNHARIEGKD
ncbi:hypothetical protein N7G274_010770 [Stereocaulon virgatum]|uniref:Uncharacterized protein n=1 Tax=Stereocaulon virgatum TaxID=373712 RepID=A0ABR3ZTX0_9LECA